MASAYNHGQRTNKLLLWLIILSIGVHIPMYLYMNGLLSSKVIQYIDLSLREIKKPFSRGLPRPPMLPREQPKKESNTKIVMSAPIQLPDFSGMNLANSADGPGISMMEGISSVTQGEDYNEMISRKIESKKKYPEGPDGKRNEATVVLSFIINPDGSIRDLKIVKPCPYKELNMAALQAIKDSAPFPRPPSNIYKGGLEVPFTLSFELI